MKKVFCFCLLFLFCGALLSRSAFSQEENLSVKLSFGDGVLNDGAEKKRVTVTEPVTVSCEKRMDSLYLIYFDTPADLVLSSDGVEKRVSVSFLRKYVRLSQLFGEGKKSVTLTFSSPVDLMEIYAFSECLPDWVQIWQEPCEKADLCLVSAHADDEQLFFAGLLPYYAGEKKLAVQVVYFTDHVKEPLRRHELLCGLWKVGVKNYPVIAPFPDRFSISGKTAYKQWEQHGIFHEDLVSFQVEMLRRFRPLVVVGHDPLGEYGHGQHVVCSATLQEAVLCAADESAYPESARRYGVWDVPKTYLHLYQENQIFLNWDEPLSSFGGKTAFQMTQEGFRCHVSQQRSWFRAWLFGAAGEITKASQIRTYSPSQYGLFRSLVGEDLLKNDLFENQMTYEEISVREDRQRREEEEILEKARLAEEQRKAEEARRRLQVEEEQREAWETRFYVAPFAAASVLLFFLLLRIFLCLRKRKNKK